MIGRTSLAQSGVPFRIAASDDTEWLRIGASIDWATVAAVGSDTVLSPEGFTVLNGQKYLRAGQPMCMETTAHAQTITPSGTLTANSFVLRVTRPDNGFSGVITVPFNTTKAALTTQINAILGSGNFAITGTDTLDTPHTFTLTLAGIFATSVMPLMVVESSTLTGGTIAIAVSAGANAGYWGPYDTAASDGRQTPARGKIGILNETILQNSFNGIKLRDFDHTGLIVGGHVWKDRLIATTGTHSLANGPTFTELEAALPRLAYFGS